MKLSTLVEHVADWHTQLQVDRTNRFVRNVALTGGTSKNGYRYTEQALKNAVSLYERRPVFLDHAADKSRPQERSTRDLVGSIVNPRWESGRIRGDIRVLDTDSGRTFLALADSDAPGVGMSHVVLAERGKTDGAVARIHDVVSVDAVVFPATTTTFRESQRASESAGNSATATCNHGPEDVSSPSPSTPSPPSPFPSLPPSSLDRESSRQGAVASSQGAQESEGEDGDSDFESLDGRLLDERFEQLLTERDELLALLHDERLRQSVAHREQTIAELLSESELPDYAVTETFRRQLAVADDALRRELLQERQRLVETARRRPPLSRERAAPSDTLPPDALFVATLKRHAP